MCDRREHRVHGSHDRECDEPEEVQMEMREPAQTDAFTFERSERDHLSETDADQKSNDGESVEPEMQTRPREAFLRHS